MPQATPCRVPAHLWRVSSTGQAKLYGRMGARRWHGFACGSSSAGMLPSHVAGLPDCPFTESDARDAATFLRASVGRLLAERDPDDRAVTELAVMSMVSKLDHFSTARFLVKHDKASASNREAFANKLVKTLVVSGLLRNRSDLRRALLLGLDASLPCWRERRNPRELQAA